MIFHKTWSHGYVAATTDHIGALVAEVLVRDSDRRAEALDVIAATGDRRAIPHPVEVVMIHEIGCDWG